MVFKVSLPWLALAHQVWPKGHSEAYFGALKLILWLSLANSGSLAHSLALSGLLCGSHWLNLWLSLARSGSLLPILAHSVSLWLTPAHSGSFRLAQALSKLTQAHSSSLRLNQAHSLTRRNLIGVSHWGHSQSSFWAARTCPACGKRLGLLLDQRDGVLDWI